MSPFMFWMMEYKNLSHQVILRIKVQHKNKFKLKSLCTKSLKVWISPKICMYAQTHIYR